MIKTAYHNTQYVVQAIEDGWFAVIYLPTGKRIECFRRKCDAMRRYNHVYASWESRTVYGVATKVRA